MTLSASSGISFSVSNTLDTRSTGYDELITVSEGLTLYPMSWSFSDPSLDMTIMEGTLITGANVSFDMRNLYNDFDATLAIGYSKVRFLLIQSYSPLGVCTLNLHTTNWIYIPDNFSIVHGSVFLLVDSSNGFSTSVGSSVFHMHNVFANTASYKMVIIGIRI